MTRLQAPDKKAIQKREDEETIPLVHEAVEAILSLAKKAGDIEERMFAQWDWLVAHQDHPKHDERLHKLVGTRERFEETLSELYRWGAALDRRFNRLSADGKRRVATYRGGINWARRQHSLHVRINGWSDDLEAAIAAIRKERE